MKKLISLLLTSLLILLVSCGADKLAETKTTKSVSALGGGGQECSCTTGDNIPVCGFNGNSHVTYLNACTANCYGVKQFVQGNCTPSVAQQVCGDDGVTYNEVEAQAAIRNGDIKKIVSYAPCGSATY